MAKFIVVDQILQNLLGHNYEYSVSTAEAARQRGWEPVVLTHREFPSHLVPAGLRMVPVFDPGPTYNYANLAGAPLAAGPLALAHHGWYRTCANHPRLEAAWIRVIPWVLWLVPLDHAAEWLSSCAMIPVRDIYRWARRVLAKGKPSRQGSARASPAGPEPAFAADLRRGLELAGARSGDHVFAHTLWIDELEAALAAMRASPPDRLPFFHFLLRQDYEGQEASVPFGRKLPSLLAEFAESGLWPSRAAFYTDTEALSEQYGALSPVPFVTAPIPFRHELVHRFRGNAGHGPPLNLAYFGDARTDKGFQPLARAVARLYPSLGRNGRVRFTIQYWARIHELYRIGGSYYRLRSFPPDYVKIVSGLLTPEQYYELLGRADGVILPYLASSYRRRSSGVLSEALAAGKPVIVPAGTWMAAQVDESRAELFEEPDALADAIVRLVERIDGLSREAVRFAPVWRKRHSPGALMECLLRTAASAEIDSTDRRAFRGSGM